MSWPYHFVDLTSEEKHLRRELIDRYGVYAQLSALIPILAFQLYRLGVWVYYERRRSDAAYSAVPTSPGLKSHRKSKAGALVREWRALLWWLEGDVAEGWGERGHWIAGGCWTLWLLFLSVHRTGDDYLHITKRFGEIAVSQFPLHYALCMKSPYTSPLALAFRSSHEQLNPWHRMLGRIIYGLLILHATWYLNFFVQSGILSTRLKAPVVIIGILAFSMLTIVASSSMEYVRRRSYRVFFVLHLTIGVTIIPLLWFHASHLRYYIVEALILFILDIVARKLDTFTEFAQITQIPHTKLLRLKIRVPASKIQRFKTAPAQHVYLSIPPKSTPANKSTPSIHDLLYNPFTVADVSENDITLVLRSQNGPTTTALQHLATLSKARPPINIEGPYGCSQGFPNLAKDFDRILLVAGGVGATFALPIYRHLREQFEDRGRSPDLVTFIWSMTASSEATWALNTETNEDIKEGGNVKIFYTKNVSAAQQYYEETLPADGSVEMQDLQGTKLEEPFTASGRQRPDLKKLVDETFAHGNEERVAILVCGPVGMARELREHVGVWVEKGRYVWYHNEGFGW